MLRMETIVDLSQSLAKVRDQGERSTCLAFATTAAHEYLHGSHQSLCVEWLYYHALRIAGRKPDSGTKVVYRLEDLCYNPL